MASKNNLTRDKYFERVKQLAENMLMEDDDFMAHKRQVAITTIRLKEKREKAIAFIQKESQSIKDAQMMIEQ